LISASAVCRSDKSWLHYLLLPDRVCYNTLRNSSEKSNLRTGNEKLEYSLQPVRIGQPGKITIYTVLFLAVVLSVLRIVDYRMVTILVVAVMLVLDRHLLLRVDYCLLGTFICFFIAIDNLSHFQALSAWLQDGLATASSSFFGSVLLSQFISNVPCAILIANYSQQWPAVLLGVNVGGMGTLIASMASVIAYRYYVREYKRNGYLGEFIGYSLLSLAVFLPIGLLLVFYEPTVLLNLLFTD